MKRLAWSATCLVVVAAVSLASADRVNAQGTGICLDGVSGAIPLGDLGVVYQSISVELRFQFDGIPPVDADQHLLFYEGSGGELQIGYGYSAQGILELGVGLKFSASSWQGTSLPLAPWTDGRPHHFAVVYDASQDVVTMYVDGLDVASAPTPDEPLHNPHFGAAIGRYGGTDGVYRSVLRMGDVWGVPRLGSASDC